jgi:hypothetical protein
MLVIQHHSSSAQAAVHRQQNTSSSTGAAPPTKQQHHRSSSTHKPLTTSRLLCAADVERDILHRLVAFNTRTSLLLAQHSRDDDPDLQLLLSQALTECSCTMQ